MLAPPGLEVNQWKMGRLEFVTEASAAIVPKYSGESLGSGNWGCLAVTPAVSVASTFQRSISPRLRSVVEIVAV